MRKARQIPFDDLERQYQEVAADVERATAEVWRSGKYVLTQGDRVKAFERAFADYNGTEHCVGVSSGTAALAMSVRALSIGPGHEVIVPANTYVATVFAISYTGATPVLVDVDPQFYTMDPDAVKAALTERTAAILPVHLFGCPADMDALARVASEVGVPLIEDAAQAHGARLNGRRVGSFGAAGCFSFYPTKNLGAFGDAGAIVTSDPEMADAARRLRYMGQDVKYRHEVIGYQERMDEVQGAVLEIKLRKLDGWNDQRRSQAHLYSQLLAGAPVTTPVERPNGTHVYYVYTIRAPRRDELSEYLESQGIVTSIFYPLSIPEQPAYAKEFDVDDYPVTARAQQEILSLPVFPGYTEEDIRYVAEHVQHFYAHSPRRQ